MKFRGNKTIMSLALLGVIATSAGTAFAAEGDPSVTVKGTVTLPTVSLELPTGEQAMVLDVYNESGKGQVQATKFDIKNNSKLAVDIALKNYEVELNGAVKPALATSPVSPTSTKKEIFLYLNEVDKDATSIEKTDFDFTYDSKADSKKVVKAGTTDLNQSYGEIAGTGLDGSDEGGTKSFRLFGNLNEKAAWSAEDTISVTPIFKATLVKHTEAGA